MKVKFLHWYNALAATFLTLLGFSSCSSENGGGEEPICLYGTPMSSFHFKGNVTDEDGTPIQGIKAVLVNSYYYDKRERLDSAYTDSKGNFLTDENHITGSLDYAKERGKLKVILEDVDGEAHGGEFAPDTIKSEDITILKVKEGGNSAWDIGSYEVTANGKMKKTK